MTSGQTVSKQKTALQSAGDRIAKLVTELLDKQVPEQITELKADEVLSEALGELQRQRREQASHMADVKVCYMGLTARLSEVNRGLLAIQNEANALDLRDSERDQGFGHAVGMTARERMLEGNEDNVRRFDQGVVYNSLSSEREQLMRDLAALREQAAAENITL